MLFTQSNTMPTWTLCAKASIRDAKDQMQMRDWERITVDLVGMVGKVGLMD